MKHVMSRDMYMRIKKILLKSSSEILSWNNIWRSAFFFSSLTAKKEDVLLQAEFQISAFSGNGGRWKYFILALTRSEGEEEGSMKKMPNKKRKFLKKNWREKKTTKKKKREKKIKKMIKKEKAILFTVVSCFSAPKSVNYKCRCLCGWFSLHWNAVPWNPNSSRIFPGQRASECLCQTKQKHGDALG